MSEFSTLHEGHRNLVPQLFEDYKGRLNDVDDMRAMVKEVIRLQREAALTDSCQEKAEYLRDLALIDLAWAAHKVESDPRSSATMLYAKDGASELMKTAKQLDPKNRDNQQLEAIKFELECIYPEVKRERAWVESTSGSSKD